MHVCPGAPSTTNRMSLESVGPSPLDDPVIEDEWQREFNETILQSFQQTLLLDGVRGKVPGSPGIEFYTRLADEKCSVPAAYFAGVRYKNRLLGRQSSSRWPRRNRVE